MLGAPVADGMRASSSHHQTHRMHRPVPRASGRCVASQASRFGPERSGLDKGRGVSRKGTEPPAVASTAGDLLTSGHSLFLSPRHSSPPKTQPRVQTKSRLRVAVDVDEVLGRFIHSLNQFCMEEYGLEYDVSDYFVYDFAKVWRCSQEESNHKVHEFFKSYHFSAGIEVIPGSRDSLQRLHQHHDLMVVTSRQHVIQQPTLEWLDQHFPSIFTEVHFGNHFALEGASKKKSEICRAIGAHVLIDDNPGYAMECAEAGIHVLLYDWDHEYPWSKTRDGPTHDRIIRVRDWREVELALSALAVTLA